MEDDMATTETLEINRQVVRKFLEALPERDLDAIGECLADNVVQYYQHPSNHNDDGTQSAASITGRANILDEIGTYFYTLYQPGTVSVTIQNLIAEGDYVAGRFVLKALTTRKGEVYENYYFFLYRCENGKVVEYWEYLDSKYAAARLFGN
jgi:ketosteroid isomerase-like protein